MEEIFFLGGIIHFCAVIHLWEVSWRVKQSGRPTQVKAQNKYTSIVCLTPGSVSSTSTKLSTFDKLLRYHFCSFTYFVEAFFLSLYLDSLRNIFCLASLLVVFYFIVPYLVAMFIVLLHIPHEWFNSHVRAFFDKLIFWFNESLGKYREIIFNRYIIDLS